MQGGKGGGEKWLRSSAGLRGVVGARGEDGRVGSKGAAEGPCCVEQGQGGAVFGGKGRMGQSSSRSPCTLHWGVPASASRASVPPPVMPPSSPPAPPYLPPPYPCPRSGCGNTLNCNQPVVRQFILDCLKHWVTEYHVDGFRWGGGEGRKEGRRTGCRGRAVGGAGLTGGIPADSGDTGHKK